MKKTSQAPHQSHNKNWKGPTLGVIKNPILQFYWQTENQFSGSKIYWSDNPEHFPVKNYIGNFPYGATEINCDSFSNPNNAQWFISFTRPQGWGIRDIKWTPPIATPVQ